MKIRKIKIHNVKGISEYCVDALLLPNRPNILVAPNGFGKSSIATAFASIASGGINLSEDDAHNNDLANLLRVEIELTDGSHADELQPQCMETWQVAEVSCNCDSDMLLHVFEDIIIEEPQIFYSHSDHLGSANWITDMTGTPVQYIHYMPYGEQLVYQTLTDYDERFKFTGKERDDETGYDFFGARYHASALPSWLSVDPLADKYPGISPYAYCNWNPIKYVDPDGRGVFPSGTALRQAGESVVNNPRYLRNGQTTYCNLGAQAINAQSGDHSLRGLANKMGASLRNPEIATELSQSAALEYANMGAVVFASYISNGNKAGHIAVVAPTEELTYSPSRNEFVVSVFNVGLQNGEMPLSKAFGKRSVGMYILNSDLNIVKDKMLTIDGGNLQELVVIGESTIKFNATIEGIDVKLPNANINL